MTKDDRQSGQTNDKRDTGHAEAGIHDTGPIETHAHQAEPEETSTPYTKHPESDTQGRSKATVVAVYAAATGAMLWIVSPAAPVLTSTAFLLLATGIVLVASSVLAQRKKQDSGPISHTGTRNLLGPWTRTKTMLFIGFAFLFILPVMIIVTGIHLLAEGTAIGTTGTEAGNGRLLAATGISTVLLASGLFHSSRQLPLRAPSQNRTRGILVLGATTIALALVTVLLAWTPGHRETAPILLSITAWTLLGLVYLGRPLPSPWLLYSHERQVYNGPTHVTHTKSFWMPLLAASSILVWGSLFALFYSLGTPGIIAGLGHVGFIVAGSVVLLCAVALTLTTGFLSSRPDELPIYRTTRSKEQRTIKALLILSGILCAGFLTLMAFSLTGAFGYPSGQGRWVEFMGLAAMSLVGPYGFYYAYRQRRVRLLEERFPGFLRDLAAARKAGLTLEQAILMARRGDYGELGPEIEKMADQLSWKMPFEQVLQEFSDRVRTPLVERSVSLIQEASWTGGNIASVLEAAAKDAQEVQKTVTERHTTTRVYAGIVYIGFFIFLGVAAVLYTNLVPELVGAADQVGESGGDQGEIQGLNVNPDITLTDFRVFYFIAALAQATGGGFVAGLMGSGKWPNGLRHIFMMCGITIAVFVFLA